MPVSQEISSTCASYWQTCISDAFKESIQDDSAEDYIVQVTRVLGKRGSIKGWGRGSRGGEKGSKYEVAECALLWVAELSGHSDIYTYLVSCITQQVKQVSTCLEKLASFLCLEAQSIRPERLSTLTFAPFLCTDSQLGYYRL